MDSQRIHHSDPKRHLNTNRPQRLLHTAQIREDIYISLISGRQFPEEQKGCRKGWRRTGSLQYFDQLTLKECKMREKM